MPAFGSVANTTYASRANTEVTKPSGTVSGDTILVWIIVGAASPPTITPPSGFELVTATPALPTSVTAGGFSLKGYVYKKIAGGSEPSAYKFTHTTASSQAIAVRVTGAGATPTIQATNKTGTGTTTTYTGLTTKVKEALILLFGHDWGDTANNLTPPTGSTPTFTERVDTTVSYCATGVLASAGETGNKTMTNNSNNTPNPWAGVMIAVEAGESLTPVSRTLATAYALKGAITRQLPTAYALRALVSRQLPTAAAIRASISRVLPSSYALRSLVARELASAYEIKPEPFERTGTVELGAFVDNESKQADWDAFNATIAPRSLDVGLWYAPFTIPIIWGDVEEQAAATGIRPAIAWFPRPGAQGTGTDGTLGDVTTGVLDTYLKASAKAIKDYGDPVIIRLAHEPNGDFSEYEYGNGYETAAEYIAGYRYIVDLFAAEGVTNVEWCWNPYVYDPDFEPVAEPTQYYPGDAYVDLIGLDGYASAAGPAQPAEIFQSTYESLSAYGKPMAIMEAGVSVESGLDRGAWMENLASFADWATALTIVVYFSLVWEGGDDTIDGSGEEPETAEAFAYVVNHSPFTETASLTDQVAALPILDDLQREENPLSHGGDWSQFGDNIGKATPTGWTTQVAGQNPAMGWTAENFSAASVGLGVEIPVLPVKGTLILGFNGTEVKTYIYFLEGGETAYVSIQTVAGSPPEGTRPLLPGDEIRFYYTPTGAKLLRKPADGPWEVIMAAVGTPAPGAEYAYAYFSAEGSEDTAYRITNFTAGELVAEEVTPVGRELATAYAIRNALSRSLPSSYAVRGAVERVLASAYALRGSVTREMPSAYGIWGLIGRVLPSNYALRAAIARELLTSYALRRLVEREAATAYAIRALVARELASGYALRGQAAREFITAYDILVEGFTTVERELPTRYALRALVARQAISSYAIRVSVARTLVSAYGIRGAMGRELLSAYAIRQLIAREIATQYALIGLASRVLPTSYALHGSLNLGAGQPGRMGRGHTGTIAGEDGGKAAVQTSGRPDSQ